MSVMLTIPLWILLHQIQGSVAVWNLVPLAPVLASAVKVGVLAVIKCRLGVNNFRSN